MTDKQAVPSFVDEAEVIHPGVEEEYRSLRALVRIIASKPEANEFRRTVLLQAGVAWQHYQAILLLLGGRFGIQALIVCRALFEVIVGTLCLLRNPNLLTEFTDYGKFLFYEECLRIGLSGKDVARIAPECEAIKSRIKKRRRWEQRTWHGSSVKKMATAVGLGDTYDLLYPDASSASHGDALKTLSYGSRGWTQSLRHFLSDKEADAVRYNSFWLTGFLLHEINKQFDLGHDRESQTLFLLMNARAKAAAMPN